MAPAIVNRDDEVSNIANLLTNASSVRWTSHQDGGGRVIHDWGAGLGGLLMLLTDATAHLSLSHESHSPIISAKILDTYGRDTCKSNASHPSTPSHPIASHLIINPSILFLCNLNHHSLSCADKSVRPDPELLEFSCVDSTNPAHLCLCRTVSTLVPRSCYCCFCVLACNVSKVS